MDDGYTFVSPKTPEVASALLDAAKASNEEPHVVRTATGGFIVPNKVAKKYEAGLGAGPEEDATEAPAEEEEEQSSTPDDSWKNADIAAWAQDHGVDLGGATKKADMLAAILSADKE
jgi:hypothetical protein